MPLSLWFVLRKGNPFEKTAQELISDTIPNLFLSKDQIQEFPPHVTVASGIEVPNGKSPQEWLDSLDTSEFRSQHNEVKLELDEVQSEDPFFRKLNIALKDNDNLNKFASAVRSSAGLSEPEGGYRPHFSLFYADTPTKEVKNKQALIEMKIGFAIGDLFACCGGALCIGGSMVLVDTSRPIKEWKDAVVAERETEWTQWRITRNLV
ncbi:Putative cyclic phosphodiesterase, 2',3'-cyclic-nucleotide 3'-phosphodiesterase [Septoria linicola]|uniref:Cyclic phosphodiesterase, 2',3'-cyclic-nucleotide 3'-phosphodiesterase n=1 Tax=Septoria linicola TaxID=215465 RepID=A0A9Q9AYR0_9PEZI|nr:Putative cyclic phosphodiesterase, 2',3'-cyclic-nucleotide 3'-phosphodiesterase [Septoria linicola]